MKFRVDGLGLFGGGHFDTLEEAQNNSCDKKGRKGSIIIELSENEYMEMMRQKYLIEQKNISLQQELKQSEEKNKKIAMEISGLKNELLQAKENITHINQLLDTERNKTSQLENDIAAMKRFLPGFDNMPGPEKVVHNPYACGIALQKGKPSPQEVIEHTDRSQVLLKHLSRCQVITRLAVERLLGCGRKSARKLLSKMWHGGYLEYVNCISETGPFHLYFLPGNTVYPKTANQACQLAILSLLYVSLTTSINTFKNLTFKLDQTKNFCASYASFVYTRQGENRIIEKPRNLYVIPVRKNQEKPNRSMSELTNLYIFPLGNIEDAKKMVAKGDAIMIDDDLIKNNMTIYYK